MFRFRKKKGISVAIIGTDGAGKSTIIAEISRSLKSHPYNEVYQLHLRPNLFPSLGRLFGKSLPQEPVVNPHSAKPSGFFGSLCRLIYYTADYIFGFWLKIYPALKKKKCIFIFDRYYYDYFFDSKRSRIELPIWIIRLFSVFIPRPDLVLCLGADARKIHSRKPELPLDEIERQLSILKEFCNCDPRNVWVDTGEPIQDSVDDALKAITKQMAARS